MFVVLSSGGLTEISGNASAHRCRRGWARAVARRTWCAGRAHALSSGVLLVGIPARLEGIMRTVIDLDEDCLLVGDRGSVDVALLIAIEGARRQDHSALGVLVPAGEAEHELIGGVV